jgi:hypothetical protein
MVMTERGLDLPTALPGEWTFWADHSDARPPPTGYGQGALNRPGYHLETQPIGPVQVIGFTAGWVLNGWGNGEAIIPISQEGSISRADLMRFYGWRLWALWKGQPVWCGLPTGLRDDGGAAVAVSLVELPGYLERKQHAMRWNMTNQEQTLIGSGLAARVENIAMPIRRVIGSPAVNRDRTYDYLEGQSRGELLQNLSQVINGVQFRTEYDINPASGRPRATLVIASGRVGSGASGLGFTVPGDTTGFTADWSGELYRNRTFAVGDLADTAPANARRPVRMVYNAQTGVPNLDVVEDYPGVVLTATLQQRAEASAQVYRDPTLELGCTVPVQTPPITSYGVGDDVTVSITDELMPEGMQLTAILNEASWDAAAGTCDWQVTTPQPPPRIGKDYITQRFGNLESQLGRVWRAGGRIEALPPGGDE